MAATPLGGSAKLNLNLNPHPHPKPGLIHGARTRHPIINLNFPMVQFSCNCSLSSSSSSPEFTNPTPLLQKEDGEEQERGIMCEACEGNGWLLCDFCEGQKVNVQSKTKSSRVYRRCPTCKAVGCILCEKCKVYKCVTLPDIDDVAQL